MSTKKNYNSTINSFNSSSFNTTSNKSKIHNINSTSTNSNFNLNPVVVQNQTSEYKTIKKNIFKEEGSFVGNSSFNTSTAISKTTINNLGSELNTQSIISSNFFGNTSSAFNKNSGGNVQVMCRFRPISDKERENSKSLCTDYIDNSQVSIRTTNDLNTYRFSFDRIFSPDSAQEEVFEIAAKPIIESVLEGFNGTIFAYGQTSSGKTYTMMGDLYHRESEGIIPRMVKHVFNCISSSTSETEYTVKLSMMEIYLERIRDLVETSRINLNIREDKNKGIFVEDLSEHYVASEEEVIELIGIGLENRTTGVTNMNDYSSRSHTILTLTIKSSNVLDLSSKTGKLFLVDLAGSEKISKTGATGLTLEEAKMINSSLSTLGMVINSLTDERSSHIPYRESKITRILQESLGGNAKTCLIITCSPSSYNDSETLSTLRFGMRAKKIENKPKINKEISAAELKIQVEKLENHLNEAELRIVQLERFIQSNGLLPPKRVDGLQMKMLPTKKPSKGNHNKVNSSYDEDNMKLEYDFTLNNKTNTDIRKTSYSTQKNNNKNFNTKYSEISIDLPSNNNLHNNYSSELNEKIYELLNENKLLSHKLKDAEETLEKYLIEVDENKKLIKNLFSKKYNYQETEKENINKIEFLERKIKKLKYEQAEKDSNKTEIYNNSNEPIKAKLEELVQLISENQPSFEFYKQEFIREIENNISKFKAKVKYQGNNSIIKDYDNEDEQTKKLYTEIENKFKQKIEALIKENEETKLKERELNHLLTNNEKTILTLKEKINYLDLNSGG